MLMNGIVNLATTMPSAPGYIGTFDAPGIAVLTAYGVPQATRRRRTRWCCTPRCGCPITPVGGVLPCAGRHPSWSAKSCESCSNEAERH